MALVIAGPVGMRNLRTQVKNHVADQQAVVDALSAISLTDGGVGTEAGPIPLPIGTAGTCPFELATAISTFQLRWAGEGLIADGVVDPSGKAIRKLNSLLAAHTPVTVVQTLDQSRTLMHEVTNPVIAPVSMGGNLVEIPLTVTMSELLFQVTSAGQTFWVGAAIPLGTTDLSSVQVYFHPTVVQAGVVHAADTDYAAFTGGWSRTIQRYVAMEGGQLAGARLMPLLVPFTTMAAIRDPSRNMFGARPVEVLQAVLDGIAAELGLATTPVAAIGVSSFSSGITALRLFLSAFGPTGLVREVTDFDSPFIVNEPKALTHAPGAVSRCFTQVAVANPEPGYIAFRPASFATLRTFTDPHAALGFMAYHQAMLVSTML